MKISCLLFALLLSGCVSVKPVTLSDGTQGHAITCNGTARSMGDCAAKAGEICGTSGYTVQERNSSTSMSLFSPGPAMRDMFIKCGKNG